MLGPTRIVLADGTAASIHFVDIHSGAVETVGRRGDGPGEFRQLRAVGRASNGIFADDPVQARVTLFNNTGELTDVVTYDPTSFRGKVIIPRPIGTFADGAIIFRDSDPLFSERPDGPYRERIEYLALLPDGSRTSIAEAPGREMVRRNLGPAAFAAYEKPFWYSSLETVLDQLVVVADTETGNVVAHDRTGEAVMEFGFGAGVLVSEDADERWREERIARSKEAGRRNLPADAPPGASALLSGLRGMGADEEDFYRSAEGNATAPALSRILVDGDGRVWARRYSLPGAETAIWQRWRPGEPELDGMLRLPAAYRFLGASGDRVLLRAADDLGVQRAVVYTLKGSR